MSGKGRPTAAQKRRRRELAPYPKFFTDELGERWRITHVTRPLGIVRVHMVHEDGRKRSFRADYLAGKA